MAIDALEIVVIGVILVVIVMWGPSKIPELARAFGRAKKEFDTASKEANTASSPPGQTNQVAPAKTGDELLLYTARQLGISTEGKTREQVSQEIIWKTSQK